MTPEPIELVLRALAAFSTLLLAAIILSSGRGRPAAIPGALFALAVAAFVITSTRGASGWLGWSVVPLTALCVTKAVWFWLFSRALFRENSGFEFRHGLAVALVALAGSWQQLVFIDQQRAGTASAIALSSSIVFDAVLGMFVLLGLYEAWRGLRIDLVERRRSLRLTFLGATGMYLVIALIIQGYNLLAGTATPAPWVHLNLLVIGCAGMMVAWSLLQPRARTWLDAGRQMPASSLNRIEQQVLKSLQGSIESGDLLFEDGLTIGRLANSLGTQEHILRRVVNRGLGYRNFNDFLHGVRIRKACEQLSHPQHARRPITNIAMQVGYGSIGTFNRAFKARTGMTPSDYRRRGFTGA